MNNNVLDNLNEKQVEAVETTEGRVMVVAGAGSGKTRVLAHRYAYLVNELGIDPANILCMTFTNKAAQEMKTRISKLVDRAYVNDFVCTIHGFCLKILRKEIYRIGYPQNFVIIDDEDAKTLAKQVMSEMNLDATDITIRQFLKGVIDYKIFNNYIERILLPNSKVNSDDVSESERFIQLQLKSYAIDFYDMIAMTLFIFNHFEDARKYWQEQINYVMVDEVQDCSASDWAIINTITEEYGNLFIVGDPDQAIYEWRGASPDGFVNFQADHQIVLNQNYRSTPNILNVANSIISNNKNRIPKELFTIKPSSNTVIYYHGKTDNEEADWISSQILEISKKGEDLDNCAILYRASYLSRAIEQSLLKNHIKYVVWGGIRFFERKEIKDALCYLRLIAYQDDFSFKRIINTPSRKFGDVSMKKLQKLAEIENASLYTTLQKYILSPDFNKPSLINYLKLIEDCREMRNSVSISDLMDHVLRESGLTDMYRTEGDQDRLDNIAELMNSINYYESVNSESDYTLDTYLQDIALYTNTDYKNDGVTVKLMTIHQAKGLEFPYVFVCGLSEGIFPSHRTIRERKTNGEEEERRLMYVAVTRAEKALFLTDSEGYNYNSGFNKYPSRFLTEIKENS